MTDAMINSLALLFSIASTKDVRQSIVDSLGMGPLNHVRFVLALQGHEDDFHDLYAHYANAVRWMSAGESLDTYA